MLTVMLALLIGRQHCFSSPGCRVLCMIACDLNGERREGPQNVDMKL